MLVHFFLGLVLTQQSTPFAIPQIDLNDDSARQVVVDREDGQYLGHPTTALLDDQKTILCVYPKGHGKGAIQYKRSSDGGKTWSERLATPKSWETSKETPTIHLISRPDGSRRLLLFSGLYPIRQAMSDDLGKTWSELKPIGEYGGIVAISALEQQADGMLLALFHDDGRFISKKPVYDKKKPVFTVYKILSKDAGDTWSSPEPIASEPGIHLCEPGLIRSPDKKEIAVLLRENSRTRNSFVIFSRDEGKNWSKPVELPRELTGDRHTGKYGQDGRLLISFRDMASRSPTQGDWVCWIGTYDDIKQQKVGQYRVRLKDNHNKFDCAYPGVEVVGDTFVVTTYGHWQPGQKPYILSVRVTLKELDQLRSQLK